MHTHAQKIATPPDSVSATLNDVHSKLNETRIQERVAVGATADVVAALDRAAERRLPVAICGGRHAMGGQQFVTDGVVIDMSKMEKVLNFDPVSGTIEVQAGIQWPALMEQYLALQRGRAEQWGIRQKQTGADRLSIGGALAANIHGRVLNNKPLVEDIVSFKLVDATGRLLNCSRHENASLFRLAIGGYGLFGVIVTITLQLVWRQKLQRVVKLCDIDGLMQAFDTRIDDGYHYGDFQFATDERSTNFLRRGVFSCYRPVDISRPIPDDQVYMTERRWQDLLVLAHQDKARAFEAFAEFYLSSNGQIYWSDAHQFSLYLDDYHAAIDRRLCAAHRGSEMITELYVPREQLVQFMERAKSVIRAQNGHLIYGTIRLIKKDDETFLAWAKQDYCCVIFNLHVEHTAIGIAASRGVFLALIDAALQFGGSYFLTYHRHASREQILSAYPQLPAFLREKEQRDPDGLFSSDWFRHYRYLLAGNDE